jgi:Glycosyl transferase family group 2
VTEDADLGYRLARDGYRCGVIAPPTWEEAPVTLKAWIAQRTRWIKGHMQTWLVLMREPVRVTREMGLPAFLSMHLVLGAGAAAALLNGPLLALLVASALMRFSLIGPADLLLAACGYASVLIAAARATADADEPSHARAALSAPLYWPLAMIAALRALAGLLFRPHAWTKTAHGVSLRGAAPRFDSERADAAENGTRKSA